MGPDNTLAKVVDALCAPSRVPGGFMLHSPSPHHQALPSRDAVISMVEDLRSVLFPGYFGVSSVTAENVRFHVGSTLDRVRRTLQEQIMSGLCFVCALGDARSYEDCQADAAAKTDAFLARLPEVRRLLATDAQAAFEGDPAATSPAETIFCYPGMLAITNQRLAHELHKLKVPLIPRMITEHAHSLTGIDIHPGARIDTAFFIDHGTGTVIGETTLIGKGVRLYQGVTLGAKSFPLDEHGNPIKGIDRHPIVEDEVIVYSGATILGRVTIGKGSVIGGNVWLTQSVPPGSRISQPHQTNA
ncbi:MAG: serine acetyltransferase [Elusimicrobia bacterium GWA2_69_24]|nr:MAG: serine acetyltransferase [Elusimicrobia bacterium GWA2_69_24]HBL16546.1 serine acetyltransferase [Elusimicrobiota bacterium]